MQITSSQAVLNSKHTKSPNFKSVSLVQIPHKAFSNPKSLIECSKLFEKTLNNTISKQPKNIFQTIIDFITPKTINAISILESSGYTNAKLSMEKNGMNYSINWLTTNTGLPIKEALNNDSHSFYVYTQDHKNYLMKFLNMAKDNGLKYVIEGFNKYPDYQEMAEMYAMTKLGIDIDKSMSVVTGNTPIKKFKINSLDEIQHIIKDLDL